MTSLRVARALASSAVQYAVKIGRLPAVTEQQCADCGQAAATYHHHRGYEPADRLDVVPLCWGCHRQRHGHPSRPLAAVQTTLRVPQDVYERMAKLAAKEGIPINTWATRAIEREADRLERQPRPPATHEEA